MKPLNIKKRFSEAIHWMFYDPKRLIRFVVLFGCSIVVVFQLSECFKKLIHPPITTHSHFDLNETMSYPAVTFCREPAYKIEVMEKYNLAHHPKYTSHWKNFPFNDTTLDEFFLEATYNMSEYFTQYGLNGEATNINVLSSLHFNYGECQTFNPLAVTKDSWKHAGYSIILKHDLTKDDFYHGEIPPGWHVFIHELAEGFAENRMQTSGRVEYLYVEVNEEIEIKLTTQLFTMIPSLDNTCSDNIEFSSTRCGEWCHWKNVVAASGCSGPWMDLDVPYCDNCESMNNLITNYNYLVEAEDIECGCKHPCCSTIFSAFVMSRKDIDYGEPASQIWIYYTSKLVTVIEERHGYDLSQFVADMGGSLGFLLGLSVLGLIGVLEKLLALIFIRQLIVEDSSLQVEKKEDKSLPNNETSLADAEVSKSNAGCNLK